MFPTPNPARPARFPETYGDQRSRRRYPIMLEVEYRMNRRRVVLSGSARTLNISSGGVLFEVKDSLPASGPIRLILNWPVVLDTVCPLKLVIDGHIVRNEGNRIAIRIKHHAFYTTGAPSPTARLFSEKMRADQERFLSNSQLLLSNSQLRHSGADPEDQWRHARTLPQKRQAPQELRQAEEGRLTTG
jgi:hypothetical protein